MPLLELTFERRPMAMALLALAFAAVPMATALAAFAAAAPIATANTPLVVAPVPNAVPL
jgi:hypothetical protein